MLFTSLSLPVTLVFRGRAEAILLSPLVGLMTANVAGMLHLFFDVRIISAWLLFVLGSYVFIGSREKLRKQVLVNWRRPLTTPDFTILIVGSMFVIGFVFIVPPPLWWDARSIWFFHASWLIEGSQVYEEAQKISSSLSPWSHPSYPIGGSASIAIAWQLYGGVENLWSAVRLVAALTLCASLLTVRTLLNSLENKISLGYQVLLSLILTPTLFLVYGGIARHGYMDPLLANLISLASVTMMILIQNNNLTSEERSWLLTLAGFSMFCATSVKQEGFWFCLILTITFVLVDKNSSKHEKIKVSLFPLLSYMVWKFSMFAVGSNEKGDAYGISSNLAEIFSFDSPAWRNFQIVYERYFAEYLFVPTPLIGLFFVTLLFATIAVRKSLKTEVLIFAILVWLGNWVLVLAPYMFGQSRSKLDWWLPSSFDRIVTSQLLFTYVFVAFVLVSMSNERVQRDHQIYENNSPKL